MTVTAAFCPLSLQTLFDRTGLAISGAKIYFYDGGTTTARTVYRDSGLILEYPTPLLADAYGRIPAIFVGLGPYKIVARDASDNFLFQADNIPGGVTVASSGSGSTPVYWVTGDLKPTYTANSQDGWVLANGMAIGSSASAGTSRANDDCQDLFIALWNADATLAVSGGRGVNATADWNGSKTIALPDLRGRVLAGCDGMGNSLAGILSVMGLPNAIGLMAGAEAVTLDLTQIANHSHTVTVAAAGGFTPSGTITGDGAHVNTGTTDPAGSHVHGIKQAVTGAGGTTLSSPTSLGSVAMNTEAVGDHQHSFTTSSGGTHAHGFAGNAQGDHTHTASATSTGGGLPHSNMQPTILVYFQIKL